MMTSDCGRIEFKDVSFSFSGREILKASFTVEQGEKILLRGGVGSGKTTAFRILTGLIPVFYRGELKGEVRVSGEKNPLNFRDHFYCAFQCPEEQIVFDTVMDEVGSIDEKLISKLKLKHLLEKRTHQLSDGEKQLVVILTAILSSRECMGFDEALSHLYPERAEKILKIILEDERTVIFSDKRKYFEKFFDRVISIGKSHEYPPKIPQADFGEEIVSLTDVSFSYPESIEPLLEDVNLSVAKGEIVSITGDNGSGKTTLLKIISGILEAEGKAEVNGKVSLSLQYPNYSFVERTVRDELQFLKHPELINQVKELLSRHPHSLSVGESKLLSVIKSFDGDVLLLDEPAVGQEESFRFRLLEWIRRFGKTAIIATHDMKLAELSDSIYEIRKKKLVKVEGRNK
jgi:energy-coupling factor transport system ATP-binding protein